MTKRKKKRGVTIEKRNHFERASIDHLAATAPITVAAKKVDGPYSFIQYRERQIQRENPGLPLIEANRIAIWEGPEAEEAAENQRREARLEAAECRVGASMLQREGFKPKGSGGGGGSRREKKPKWFCRSCKLEFCIHRPTRGQPRKTNPRTLHVTGRISAAAKEALKKAGISVGEAVENYVAAKAIA